MTAHHDAYGTAGAVGVIAQAVAARVKAFGAAITRRKAIDDLGRLDERMLGDIGLTRADVEAAARWSLWGDPTERLAAAAEERRSARRG